MNVLESEKTEMTVRTKHVEPNDNIEIVQFSVPSWRECVGVVVVVVVLSIN